MADRMPIDIHLNKMHEWLDARATVLKKRNAKDFAQILSHADTLVKNVRFEIPGLRKAQQRCQNTLNDVERRRKDYTRLIAERTRTLEREYAELGIAGEDVEEEIPKMARRELPKLYKRVEEAAQAKQVGDAINWYEQFRAFHGLLPTEGRLEYIRYLHEQGNGRVYDLYKAVGVGVPDELGAGTLNTTHGGGNEDESDAPKQLEIDWGDDFGMSVVAEPTNDYELVGHEDAIDMCVLTDAEVQRENELQGLRLSLLDNETTRASVLHDLSELLAFLALRAAENAAQLDTVSSVLQARLPTPTGTREVGKLKAQVQAVYDGLTSRASRHIILLNASSKLQERLAHGLRTQQQGVARCQQELAGLDDREAAAQVEFADIQPQLKEIVTETKKVQKLAEKLLSVALEGCEVNIVGEINTL